MRERWAAFFVPPLTVLVLLYQVLAHLQIAVAQDATLIVAGVALAAAAGVGLLAVFGHAVVRVLILATCAVVLLDVAFPMAPAFRRLAPESREPFMRDDQRVADLHRLKAALEEYSARIGPLPMPREYGEGVGPVVFWENWWDLSTDDQDRDGRPFLDFLAESGVLASVPVDPLNEPGDPGDPRGGRQYVYFIAPPDGDYAGGTCAPDRGMFLLAITDLETERSRPPAAMKGSGCACLWQDAPDFFQDYFDYVLCGTYPR